MKRILIFTFLLVAGLWPASSFADTAMVMANGTFDVPDIFTLEFYDREPDKYLYTTNIPFTNMDPTKTWVAADERAANDQKNDLGLLCKSNLGEVWYLKIQGSPNDFFLSKIKYGLWRPWNMKLGQPADGTLNEGWYPLPPSSTGVYTAGVGDLSNLGEEWWQQGTLCGFSLAIDPSRLDPTQIYHTTIQFTMTTTP